MCEGFIFSSLSNCVFKAIYESREELKEHRFHEHAIRLACSKPHECMSIVVFNSAQFQQLEKQCQKFANAMKMQA